MSLSPYRRHKIYIAATMGYGLGSKDSEELAYYDMIKNQIEKDNKNRNLGIQRTEQNYMSEKPEEIGLRTYKFQGICNAVFD